MHKVEIAALSLYKLLKRRHIVQDMLRAVHSFLLFHVSYSTSSSSLMLILHFQGLQNSPLQLANVAVAGKRPLLGDELGAEGAADEAAGAPVPHERTHLVLGHAVEAQDVAVLEAVVDLVVVAALVRVRAGHLAAGLARLELLEDQLLRRVRLHAAARRVGGDDGAAVGHLGRAGQRGKVVAEEGEVVGVDLVVGGVAVRAVLVGKGQAVEGHEDRWAAGAHQLGPERREALPGGVRLSRVGNHLRQRGALSKAGRQVGLVLNL